ncbi:response regulator [Kiloniella sp.]|uniref:response regulator n=1 Tax=Kiloniella sp. TaxID=1938587 RepID=UPI003B0178BD
MDRIFKDLPIGLCHFDTDLRYLYINKWLADINGIPPEQHIGRSIADVLPDVAEHASQPILQVLETGIPLLGGEVSAETPAHPGVIRTFRHSFIPVRSEGGPIIGVSAVVEEITELKLVEKSLRQASRMEAVGQLTGGIAHDINNLLAVLMGNTEVLSQHLNSDKKLHKNVQAIIKTVERASALTDRLLAFSRKQDLSPRPVQLSGMIKGLEDLLSRCLGETIDIKIKLATNLWPALLDQSQFENALVNLALNSRDAMPKGGLLTFETSNVTLKPGDLPRIKDDNVETTQEDIIVGDFVRIEISDSGLGMPPEVLDKAFEPFFTTKENGRGSGLGLSMVYGFVKQSNGHISIESEENQGTAITLYFPRSLETVAPIVHQGDEPISNGPVQGHILIVEDNNDVREVAVSTLKNRGYEVTEASSPEQALKQLKVAEKIDLLFTDVILPGGMTGLDIAEQAKQLHPQIKLLYTTGHSENTVTKAKNTNIKAPLLKKPYRRTELLSKIQALLNVKSILVIEDDEEILCLIKDYLEDKGYNVITASGGRKGFSLFKSQQFDAVIMDVMMDKGEGFETLGWIKDKNPDINILGISANPQYLTVFKALGATDTLRKPFKMEQITTRLQRMIG